MTVRDYQTTETYQKEYKATVDHRVIAGKIHLTLYAEDKEAVEALRELSEHIKATSENICFFSTSVGYPYLAGFFICIK